jgi:hypothetical protein
MQSEGTLENSISDQRFAHMNVSDTESSLRSFVSIRRYLAPTWCHETSPAAAFASGNMHSQILLSACMALLCVPPSDGAYFAQSDSFGVRFAFSAH